MSNKQLLKQLVKDKFVAISILILSFILLATGVIDQTVFKDILMFLLI